MAAEDVLEKKGKRRRNKGGDDDSSADDSITVGKGRATPGRRSGGSSTSGGGSFLTNNRIVTYFREVSDEMAKVTWPTREDTIRLTWIVLITTVIAALVLGGLSLIMSYVIRWGLDTPAILISIVVGAVAIAGFWVWQSGRSGGAY